MSQLIGQIVLVVVAAIAASGGVYATFASRKQGQATAEKTGAEAEQIEDATWINRLNALGDELGRLQLLSDARFERLVEIEKLITDHVQWDFAMVRLARQHGWEVEDPPSLVYVKRKLQEEKAVLKQEMGDDTASSS